MSKAGVFARILKLAATLFAKGIKITIPLFLRMAKELFNTLRKRLRVSITFKAATTYTLIFSTIMFMFSLALIGSFTFFLYHQAQETLFKSARVVDHFINETRAIPEADIKKYADIEGIAVALYDKDKRIIFATLPEYVEDIDLGQLGGVSKVFSSNNQYMHLDYTSKANNGIEYVVISKSTATGVLYLVIMVGLIAVGYGVSVIFIVAKGSQALRRMLQPIDDMINTARLISASDLNTRLNVVDSHDELKDLAETFNEMLGRIQQAYERQNRFVSDASHELRTPISVIQGYANLLQRWGKEDKEVLAESVGAIKNEADNMKDLVEKLLFLARADKNTQRMEVSSFSLNELVEEVVRETRLIDSKHDIQGSVTGLVTVTADRKLIKQAMRVFVDNSVKFTPPEGVIKISGFSLNGQIIIAVEDTGIGIAREDLPYIFDRFYKSDKSRSREDGGTGLGLSIAKWIIDRHGGKIEVESNLRKGTKIRIVLPRRDNTTS